MIVPQVPQGPSPAQLEQQRQQALYSANESGIAAYNRGEYQSALNFFEVALQYSPYNPTIQHSIQRCKEHLAEAQAAPPPPPAPPPASPSPATTENAAWSQLNHVDTQSSAHIAAWRTRNGYDTESVDQGGVPLKFVKALSPGIDPIVPLDKITVPIRALEEERDTTRAQAQKVHDQRTALEAAPMTPAKEKKDDSLKTAEVTAEKKIIHLNFKISKDLDSK